MLNNPEKIFHKNRRAFIIMPNSGLVVAPVGFEYGHLEMLESIHFDDIRYAMENFPRGYFMNNELCIYQGFDMTPGTLWQVSNKNINVIQKNIPNFRCEFSVKDDTPVYLGVRVGDIGSVWEKIRRTTIKMLEKGNIVM